MFDSAVKSIALLSMCCIHIIVIDGCQNALTEKSKQQEVSDESAHVGCEAGVNVLRWTSLIEDQKSCWLSQSLTIK